MLPFLVELKADVPVGLYPIRLTTADGLSNVMLFSVGMLPEFEEVESKETKQLNDEIVTAGGRVLAVTALGSTIAEARSRAYEAVARIHFENCHYRRDIALIAVTDNIQNLR